MPAPQPVVLGRSLRTLHANGFVVIECSYAPALKLPRHGHDEAALCFPFRGAYDESVDGRTFACEPYDIIVRPPAVRHSNSYAPRGETRCVLVSVPPDSITRLKTRLFDHTRLVARETGRAIATRIHREVRLRDESSPLVVEGLILELIGTASRTRTASPPRWLLDARDFIHASWREHPSLADIARAGGVHPAHLARGFRAHLDCSPGEYLRRVRLEHARQELAMTARTIADIAAEAGFYDQSHFTAAFRRETGMTPAQFRALQTS